MNNIEFVTHDEHLERHRAAMRRYMAHKTRSLVLTLIKGKDDDVIAKLDAVSSKIDYIRGLVRADLAKKS